MAFNETGIVAVEDPQTELLEVTISGKLTDPVPEYATDDSGKVSTSLVPIGPFSPQERIPREETDGHKELLTRDIIEVGEIDKNDYGEEINHSRLYQNLNALVDAGLIEKGRKDDRTNEYATTDAARRMLERRAKRHAEEAGLTAAEVDT